jgi:hypothetical protein
LFFHKLIHYGHALHKENKFAAQLLICSYYHQDAVAVSMFCDCDPTCRN